MKFSHRHAEFACGGFDSQFVAANLADLRSRNTHQLRALDHFYRIKRFARDNHAALRLAKSSAPNRWGEAPDEPSLLRCFKSKPAREDARPTNTFNPHATSTV